MQKHPINSRQAEESAAPQQFESPQAEIKHIKQTDRTLSGFARVLEVVRDSPRYEINQGNAGLNWNWLADHSPRCAACVGALACWFFDGELRLGEPEPHYWYEHGQQALADHLQLSVPEMRAAVTAALRTAAGDWTPPDDSCLHTCPDGPFCGSDWPVDHAAVFRALADRFPGK